MRPRTMQAASSAGGRQPPLLQEAAGWPRRPRRRQPAAGTGRPLAASSVVEEVYWQLRVYTNLLL